MAANSITLQTKVQVIAQSEQPGNCWAHVQPQNAEQLAALLKECGERKHSVFLSSPSAGPKSESLSIFLDLNRLNGIVEHSRQDQVISVETGMTIAELDRILQGAGQWWPVALPGNSTIYDAIASGGGGYLEHYFGGPRNLVLGLHVALSNGNVIKTGGKVVKNVTGYDMTKLFVGSRGSFGVPTLAHLRLFARPEEASIMLAASDDLPSMIELEAKISHSPIAAAGVELVDRRVLSRGVLAGTQIEKRAEELPGKRILLCFTFGHQRVLDETDQSLKLLVPPNLVHRFSRLPLQSLDEVCPDNSVAPVVELSCSPREFRALIKAEILGSAPWHFRSRFGRLFLYDQSRASFEELCKRLSSWCNESGKHLSISWTAGLEYEARRLPDGDRATEKIIREIKNRFDPYSCMNPSAKLCDNFRGG